MDDEWRSSDTGFHSCEWYGLNTVYPNESRFLLIIMRNAYSFLNIPNEIKRLTKIIN